MTFALRRKSRKKRLAKARALGKVKVKKPMTKAQKLAKKERQAKYRWIFINGKQVRILREPTVEGLPVDEFIELNADPIFLQQNEMWEELMVYQEREDRLDEEMRRAHLRVDLKVDLWDASEADDEDPPFWTALGVPRP